MIRKWMTVLLSLLLAVSLPLSALADTQHTLTVVPGDMLASDQAIVDLLNAVDLRLTQGERSSALSVVIDDQELVSLGVYADTIGLYAHSAVLGEDVLYITWEDGFAMLTDLMKANLQQQGIDDPAAAKSIETTMQQVKTNVVTIIGAGTPALMPQAPTTANIEESMKIAAEMFPDDPQMVEYIKALYEDLTVENGTFADEARDTADQKYAMTMDADALVKMCDTNYMKTTLMETMASVQSEASQEELDKAVDEMVAEMKKLFAESGFQMVVEMYTLDAGMTVVGVDLTMNMTLDATDVEGEKLKTSMQMTADYDRLTDAEGVSYKSNAQMTVDTAKMEVLFDLYRANSGKSEGMLGLLGGGEEIVVLYQANNTAADTRVREASVYMRSGANSILKPGASDRPVIGFSVKSEPASADKLAKLEKATPDNSVDVLKLSDAEMQTLSSSIMTNGLQVFYTALGMLPTSVLNLLMSSAAQ